jgi:hypothetical protein
MDKLLFVLLLTVVVTINGFGQENDWRYINSSTIPKGGVEAKLFNNLYSQQTGPGNGVLENRSSYFTSSLSFVYGVSSRFNAGFDVRFRGVRNDALPASPFKVLSFEDSANTRYGVTTVGPKVRFAPLNSLPKLSVQSAFWIPLGDELAGGSQGPYIDWDGASWVTQIFNDFSIGENFALFGELGIWLEDIGEDRNNRFSTPVTAILSYFPVQKVTIYGIAGYSPYWQEDFDYFVQAGLGAKYQFLPQFEMELLYTYFTNGDLQFQGGKAATYNIGFRYSK